MAGGTFGASSGGEWGEDPSDDNRDESPSPADAVTLTATGIDGLSNGQRMPDCDIDWDALFAQEFGTGVTNGKSPMAATPSDRIRRLFDLLPDGRYDDAILVLSDVAAGRTVDDRRRMERAIAISPEMAAKLVRMARDERDDARRHEILASLGALANDGALRGVLSSLSEFPAGWHQTHSLAVACNHHDMFYMTQALLSGPKRARMSLDDFEQGVMPLLGTLSEFAETGFRKFPRKVTAPRRFPDGPDGDRAWGTQTSVLVTRDDVDDPSVLALMDRDDVQGRAKAETYHRGVPGYWRLGIDPEEERSEHVRMVDWMSSHVPGWGWLRRRQAIRDFDDNMLPIVRWLATDGGKRLSGLQPVEATDLL